MRSLSDKDAKDLCPGLDLAKDEQKILKYFNLYQAKQIGNLHKFEKVSLLKPSDVIDPKDKQFKKKCLLLCVKRVPQQNVAEAKKASATFVEVASIENFNEAQTIQERKVMADVQPISMITSGKSSTQVMFPLGGKNTTAAGYISSPARSITSFGKDSPQPRSKKKREPNRRKILRSANQRKASSSSIFEVNNISSSTLIHHRSNDECDGDTPPTQSSRSRNFTNRIRKKIFGERRPKVTEEPSADDEKEILVDTIDCASPPSSRRQRGFSQRSFRQQHPKSRYSTGLLFN